MKRSLAGKGFFLEELSFLPGMAPSALLSLERTWNADDLQYRGDAAIVDGTERDRRTSSRHLQNNRIPSIRDSRTLFDRLSRSACWDAKKRLSGFS
jgi:hypothetical protein